MRLTLPVLLIFALAACGGEDDAVVVFEPTDTDLDTSADTAEPADARLADLRVEGAALRPFPFDPDTSEYTGTTAAGADAVIIAATPLQDDATVAIEGVVSPDGRARVSLAYGWNAFEVGVTDRDGGVAEYTVNLRRPAEGRLSVEAEASPQTWAAGEAVEVVIVAEVRALDGAELSRVEVEDSELFGGSVPLLDDGVGPDETPGDGRFSAQMEVPSELPGGDYALSVRAEGLDTLGEAISRTDRIELSAEQAYALSQGSARFESIASTGDRLFTSGSTAYTLPFPVGLFGETASAGTELYPDQYGQVHVGRYSGGIVPGPTSRYRELVDQMWAVYHHSSSLVSAGGVYAEVQGVSPNRELVIEWRGTYRGGGGSFETQLRLRENSSSFEVVYGRMADDLFEPRRWSQFVLSGEREAVVSVPYGDPPSKLQNTRFVYAWE